MSDLSSSEMRKLEKLFGMESGYVLHFSNRTFAEFVEEATGLDIDDARYAYGSGSKANRMRTFWAVESNYLVGKLVGALIEYGRSYDAFQQASSLAEDCHHVAARLMQTSSVPDLDVLSATIEERDFEVIAKQVRDVIHTNQPEAGLDRLHTFVVKFIRSLCEERGITVSREKPLHSLFGEYVKRLRDDGHLHSNMTVRILKSSISVLESFNDVRNNQSLAHDNPILNYDESLLIFNHVTTLVRFIRALDDSIKQRARLDSAATITNDDIS